MRKKGPEICQHALRDAAQEGDWKLASFDTVFMAPLKKRRPLRH